jgi:uncharacterized membrane protein
LTYIGWRACTSTKPSPHVFIAFSHSLIREVFSKLNINDLERLTVIALLTSKGRLPVGIVYERGRKMALRYSDTVSGDIRNSTIAQQSEQQGSKMNVGQIDRWLSGLGGSALVGYGIVRRDWIGAIVAGIGGALVVRGATGHSFLYQGLGFDTSEQSNAPAISVRHNLGIKIVRAVTIQKSPDELYRFWRNFEHLPGFMSHLASITVKDATHSHWVAKAPAGREVAWDAEIINERENELIAWRSLEGSDIRNAGSVHFMPAPGGRGTVVKVVLEYEPPAGKVGSLVASLFGENPDQQVREDLRHLKAIMEAGEIPTTKGQPSGRSK